MIKEYILTQPKNSRMRSIFIIPFLFITLNNISFAQNNLVNNAKYPSFQKPYFGLKAPTLYAEVFMDEHISNIDEPEMCGAFIDNGTKFYYNALYQGNWTIFETILVNNKWTIPKPINFTKDYTDRDFTISPDGQKIYFGSNRPRSKGEEILKSLDIYVSVITEIGNWSEPQNISKVINTDYFENYPSVDATGNLYFFSNRKEGLGGCEIYESKFVEGEYQKPELLGKAINSHKHDWDSFIAPDGSYIIFSSKDRDDTIGQQDLYISFKDKNGEWTKAINMGEKVNSTKDEICPSVSGNGKYFFFTSRRRGLADIYWINAQIIDSLKPTELK